MVYDHNKPRGVINSLRVVGLEEDANKLQMRIDLQEAQDAERLR